MIHIWSLQPYMTSTQHQPRFITCFLTCYYRAEHGLGEKARRSRKVKLIPKTYGVKGWRKGSFFVVRHYIKVHRLQSCKLLQEYQNNAAPKHDATANYPPYGSHRWCPRGPVRCLDLVACLASGLQNVVVEVVYDRLDLFVNQNLVISYGFWLKHYICYS